MLLAPERPPPEFMHFYKAGEAPRGEWQSCSDPSTNGAAKTSCLWTVRLGLRQFNKVKAQWKHFESFFAGQKQELADDQRTYEGQDQPEGPGHAVTGLQVNVEPIASHFASTKEYVELMLGRRREEGLRALRRLHE